MSHVDLEELQALLDAGAKGPWMPYSQRAEREAVVRVQGCTILFAPEEEGGIDSESGRNNQADHNVCLAAGAVNALPALLEEVRAGRQWGVRYDALKAIHANCPTAATLGPAFAAALASSSVPQEKVQEAQEAGPSGGENRPLVCPHCGVEFVTADPSMLIVSCPSEAGAKAREGIHPAWLAAALKDSLSIGAHLLRSKAVPVLADGRAIPPPAPPVLGAAPAAPEKAALKEGGEAGVCEGCGEPLPEHCPEMGCSGGKEVGAAELYRRWRRAEGERDDWRMKADPEFSAGHLAEGPPGSAAAPVYVDRCTGQLVHDPETFCPVHDR